MTIIVELNTKDCQIQTRRVNDNEIYEQQAYLHTGNAYPTPFKISVPSPSDSYPSGKYTIGPSSFKVNQWGTLELDRWNFKLIPEKA